MMPTHHVPDDFLERYAAGNLDRGVALLIATHLALCPRCRQVTEDWDLVGGALLEREPPVALLPGALEDLLARLEDDDRGSPPPPPSPAADPPVIPEPLRSLTGPFDQLAWRRRAPAIWTVDTPVAHANLPVRLFRISGGTRIPAHTHTGQERGLVLSGGFTDEDGHFVRGDVSLRDGTRDHHAVVDPGDDCVVLFVNDGRLLPRTWVSRLGALFVRL